MKINTLFAICLLAFSPLAMAAPDQHGKHKQCDQAKHGAMHAEKDGTTSKTCKDMCKSCKSCKKGADHAGMDMAGMNHADMKHGDMSHAEHMKAMDKTCSTADCAKMCSDADGSSKNGDCNDRCAHKESGSDRKGG